jgi:hypothetical protein
VPAWPGPATGDGRNLAPRICTFQLGRHRPVRRALRRTARLPRHPVQRVTPEDVIDLARPRPGGHVLGPEANAIDLGREVDLHYRERLRSGGRRRRGRQGLRRACLGQLQRAASERVPVDGYFLWSAQHNFERMDGFGNRFGLIYVDFDTLRRIPKLSAE